MFFIRPTTKLMEPRRGGERDMRSMSAVRDPFEMLLLAVGVLILVGVLAMKTALLTATSAGGAALNESGGADAASVPVLVTDDETQPAHQADSADQPQSPDDLPGRSASHFECVLAVLQVGRSACGDELPLQAVAILK